MRRPVSMILLVVVALFLSCYSVRWLTAYRYFDGQPIRSFLNLDSDDFNLILTTDRGLNAYRECRTTFWLFVCPIGVAVLITALFQHQRHFAKMIGRLGLIATALACAFILICNIERNGKKIYFAVSFQSIGEISASARMVWFQSPASKYNPRFRVGFVTKSQMHGVPFWANSFSLRGHSSLYMPTWMLIWITGLPTLALYLASRRPLPGHCRCGYNLTGNTSGICPECGTPTNNTYAVSPPPASPV